MEISESKELEHWKMLTPCMTQTGRHPRVRVRKRLCDSLLERETPRSSGEGFPRQKRLRKIFPVNAQRTIIVDSSHSVRLFLENVCRAFAVKSSSTRFKPTICFSAFLSSTNAACARSASASQHRSATATAEFFSEARGAPFPVSEHGASLFAALPVRDHVWAL